MTTRAEALNRVLAAARKVHEFADVHQSGCWRSGGIKTSTGVQADTSRTRLVCRCGLTDLREALADFDATLAVGRAPVTSRAPGLVPTD